MSVVTFDANGQRQITLTETGTYTVQVRASGLTATGGYNIGLECLVPLSPVPPSLACGDLASESFTAAGEVDFFTFSGTAGDVRFLTLVITQGFGNTGEHPRATLIGPSGTDVIAFNAGTQQQLTLPETGTYVLKVQSSGLGVAGSWNLGLECLSPLTPTPPALECGDLVDGSFTSSGEVDFLTFDATAGDIRFLTLVTTSGFGNTGQTPRMTLYSPTNVNVLAFNSVGQQQVTLTETGTYVLKIQSSGLTITGAYRVGLECLVPLEPLPPELACAVASGNTIDKGGDVDLFVFDAEAGEVQLLSLVTTSGFSNIGQQPRASVFSPSNASLITFDANAEKQLNITQAGRYVVKVQASGLTGTGGYNLTLQRFGGCGATTTSTTSVPPTTLTATTLATTTSTLAATTSTTTSVPRPTTTTLPNDECEDLEGSTLASIVCRLERAVAQTSAGTTTGSLPVKLLGPVERARDRAREALSACDEATDKTARRRVKQVIKALMQYEHQLSTRKARRTLDTSLREDLIAGASAIQGDARALRKTLQCPEGTP